MAKEYLDKSGLSYFWGKIKAYITRNNIVPIASKTFTGVVASANNDPNGWLYFAKLKPTDNSATKNIYIKFRILLEAAGQVACYQDSVVEYYMYGSTLLSYSTYNDIRNTSYRAMYNHSLYRATTTGITGGYGHLLGVRLTSSWNPATAANARTITVEVLETRNCDVEFLSSMVTYANAPGTGSTNYAGRSDYDGTTQGQTISGDRNDVNYYNRSYYGLRTTYTALYRYQLCLSRFDRSLLPINAVNNSIATNKTLTTESFDPFGDIFYWASTTTYSAGANVGDGWYNQYLADLRYSFNVGGYDVASTLTGRKPLYLVCTPQSDGSAKLHTSPLAQVLPSTADGKLYIYLGQVYSDTYPYRVYMSLRHPVYVYQNGGIQEYVRDAATVNGHTVAKDVPSNAVFTDTKSDWNATSGNAQILNKPTLATVATSGSYNDLLNKPTIPTLKNVFGNVKVGSTTIAADTTQDTLELVAGSNVTLTPDATNDKVTIAATDTTYSAATTSADGLMSSTDKTKLNGIATGAVGAELGMSGTAYLKSANGSDVASFQNGAEVNQNAFSNVKVGSTTIAADSKTDTLELESSFGIDLTPDATNDKVTIGINGSYIDAAFSVRSGAANGICPLDANGKVASAYLPSGGASIGSDTFLRKRLSKTGLSASTYYVSHTFSMALTGYTPVSMTMSCNQAACVPASVNVATGQVTYMHRNASSISNLNIYADVLYIKNEYVTATT